MATLNSVSATIRIPEHVIKDIDSLIQEREEFSNRPDFIVCAIRHHELELMKIIEDFWYEAEKEEESKCLIQYDGMMSKAKESFERECPVCKGDAVTIIIRVPPGLKESSMSISSYSVKYNNFQKFVRISIVRYINFLSDIYLFNDLICGKVHDLTLESYDQMNNLLKRERKSNLNLELEDKVNENYPNN